MNGNGLTNGNMGSWTHSFELDGTNYVCNVASEHPMHRFGGVMIDLGKGDYVQSESDNKLIVLPRHAKSGTLSFVIHSLNKYVAPTTGDRLTVGVYRKGQPEPVYYKEYEVTGEEIFDECPGMDIPEGEYFMTLGNAAPYDHLRSQFEAVDNLFVYRFILVGHGEKKEHPTLLTADVTADRNINLSFADTMSLCNECIHCECYDDDYRLVGETDLLKKSGDSAFDLTGQLKESGWWIDGRHHLIVYHNAEPFVRIEFCSHERKHAVTNVEVLEMHSVYYQLCKYVKDSGNGYMFCKLNGCRRVKTRILEEYALERRELNRSLAVIGKGKPSYEVMNTLTGVLYPHYGYYLSTVQELKEQTMTAHDVQLALETLLSARRTILYDLEELVDPLNITFSRALLSAVCQRPGLVVLYGQEAVLDRIMVQYPEWKHQLMDETYWNIHAYCVTDGLRTVERIIQNKDLKTMSMTRVKFDQVLRENWDTVKDWTEVDYLRWIESEVMLRIKQRVFGDNSFSPLYLQTVLEDDVCLTLRKEPVAEGFARNLFGLERMVGLTDVKHHLNLLYKRMEFDRKREKLGLRKLRTGMPHMVFTGNPGTGKTTVAQLVGQAFKELGYLSNGQVIAVERSQLVGRYIGETERRMTELLKKAKGNVLFIDEAYSLCDNDEGDRKDFGCRVLECLLPVLADADSDMIVILAGYEKEMKQMMELNPGMKGRFPFWFHFKDYDAEELYEIAIRMLVDYDYTLTDKACVKLKSCISESLKMKDRHFHNARWVNQLVEDGILVMMAERLFELEATELNRGIFLTVTEEDVDKGFERMRADRNSAPLRKVGFR